MTKSYKTKILKPSSR